MHAITMLALALQLGAGAGGQVDPAAAAAAPAAHAQNVEAFAAPDIQKAAPTAIVAINAAQIGDPDFRPIANQVGEVLKQQGFNMVGRGEAFRNAVTVEYRVSRDIFGELPAQQTSDPRAQIATGAAVLPAYRRLTVTAYAINGKRQAQVLWRTVMAEDGFDYDVGKTIPRLVLAGRRYFGRSLTALAVADCDDFAPPLGSHIPARACGEVRASVAGGVVRRPQVTVGPLSTDSR